jgi:anti-sigma regulatory factor (Ser/Thr protein kinase)
MWRARADLPATSLAPVVSRRLVEQLLLAWDQPHLDRLAEDARLVVSELVTNAVVHAGDSGGALQLDVRADQNGCLYIAVIDASSAAPVVRELTGDGEDGRGLHIVQQLGARWGVEPDGEGGKRVWIELR